MESKVRKELFKSSETINEAEDELKERLRDDLEEVAMRFGRTEAIHALKNVSKDFSRRKYVNPYAIPNEDYQWLVEFTGDTRINVADRPPESVAADFIDQYESMSDEAQEDVNRVARLHGEAAIFAWVDLLLTDVFVENRDMYAEKITNSIIEHIDTDPL